MTTEQPARSRKFRWSTARWVFYLLVVASVAAWRFVPRPWKPAHVLETQHYLISSTATQEQTEKMGNALEMLYIAYSNRFATLPNFKREHPKLKVLLYKDRKEMRWVNPGLGWAEAFYSRPYCRAYYSEEEINPYHWMLHEATHQLNAEVAQLHLTKWLEEGLAEYFSTSRISRGQLLLKRIDQQTYPVWWINEIATATNLQTCITNGSVIPLRAIISDSGGPSMNKEFNLYYLHWWTLTHFIFDKYDNSAMKLMEDGGGVAAFEKDIGPIDTVQSEWFLHVRKFKKALAGTDVHFYKTGELPDDE